MSGLTEEQFEALRPFESYFLTAINHGYVRSMPHKDAVTLNDISKKLGCGNFNLSCPKCVLNLCKTLGKLYSSKKTQYGQKTSN